MSIKHDSKTLVSIVMACMAVFLLVNFVGCYPGALIGKYQPTIGHWIKDTNGNITGCAAGGNECAYVSIGSMQVEIPVSLANQMLEWQSNAAQR